MGKHGQQSLFLHVPCAVGQGSAMFVKINGLPVADLHRGLVARQPLALYLDYAGLKPLQAASGQQSR